MPIALEPVAQPEVLALIEALDAYQRPLYPAESHHGIDIAALEAPNVLFAVARDDEGRAIGCGAIVLEGTRGELKRMFTDPAVRGRGIAGGVLRLLETEAERRGCRELVLETGYLQTSAIALYERHGFRRCGPFGGYVEDPNSIFLRKDIAAR